MRVLCSPYSSGAPIPRSVASDSAPISSPVRTRSKPLGVRSDTWRRYSAERIGRFSAQATRPHFRAPTPDRLTCSIQVLAVFPSPPLRLTCSNARAKGTVEEPAVRRAGVMSSHARDDGIPPAALAPSGTSDLVLSIRINVDRHHLLSPRRWKAAPPSTRRPVSRRSPAASTAV